MTWPTLLEGYVMRAVVALLLALACGSLIRLVVTRRDAPEIRRERLASLRTWWILAAILSTALLLGPWGVCGMLALASGLAIRELVRILELAPADWLAVAAVYAAVPIHYLLVGCGWAATYAFMPAAIVFAIAASRLLSGVTKGYIFGCAVLSWAAMVLIVGLSYAARIAAGADLPESAGDPLSWFLLLVVLTETNDIAQALIGRRFSSQSRHPITPQISPHKSWEGFLGGLLVTIVLAIVLATGLPSIWHSSATATLIRGSTLWSAGAGVVIAISGFLGDINMSAVKRDAGVKDSSHLLPGMGGMIDRIDSLSFAAVSFYYYLTWTC